MRPSQRVELRGEISLWESQLRAGAVPSICVKSGQPAGGSLPFEFVTVVSPMWSFVSNFVRAAILPSRVGPVRGPLPLTEPWFFTLALLWLVRTLGFAVSFVCLLVILLLPEAPVLALITFILGGSAISLTADQVLRHQRPRGDVHKAASGQLWVHLRGVHPNFVAAVASQAAVQLSPDGHWYWSGSQWLATLPNGPSLNRLAKRPVPVWWMVLGMTVVWALGAFAWWDFHP